MNNPKQADLHIHTYYSDGTQSPQEVVDEAVAAGLSCIAITDHDVVDGVQLAQRAAQGRGLEVVAGIELSSEVGGKDIHILGYFIDCQKGPLVERLEALQQARIERMKKMISKLNEMNIGPIDLQEICALSQSKAVGRPHLAAVLQKKGFVSSLREAFDKYIGEGCPAYFTKYDQTPFEAIQLIKKSGGIAVMAHPMLTQKDELIPGFVQAGLDGIEVYYPYCSENVIKFYEGIARKHNLLTTGGSDAHGKAKEHTFIGKQKIPYELVERMKETVDQRL